MRLPAASHLRLGGPALTRRGTRASSVAGRPCVSFSAGYAHAVRPAPILNLSDRALKGPIGLCGVVPDRPPYAGVAWRATSSWACLSCAGSPRYRLFNGIVSAGSSSSFSS